MLFTIYSCIFALNMHLGKNIIRYKMKWFLFHACRNVIKMSKCVDLLTCSLTYRATARKVTQLAIIYFVFYALNIFVMAWTCYRKGVILTILQKIAILRYVSIHDHRNRAKFCDEVKFLSTPDLIFEVILKGFTLLWLFYS